MRQVITIAAAAAALALSVRHAPAEDKGLTPGQTFPRPGYFPTEKKVVFVIFWHHRKNVTEFGFQDFFMEADGVNDTTARKMRDALEKRYPNLTFYVRETNERDVEGVVERERKRIKNVELEWIDVKQPDKVSMPKRTVDDGKLTLTFDEAAPKGANLAGTQWYSPQENYTWKFTDDKRVLGTHDSGSPRDLYVYDWKSDGNTLYIRSRYKKEGPWVENTVKGDEVLPGGTWSKGLKRK